MVLELDLFTRRNTQRVLEGEEQEPRKGGQDTPDKEGLPDPGEEDRGDEEGHTREGLRGNEKGTPEEEGSPEEDLPEDEGKSKRGPPPEVELEESFPSSGEEEGMDIQLDSLESEGEGAGLWKSMDEWMSRHRVN